MDTLPQTSPAPTSTDEIEVPLFLQGTTFTPDIEPIISIPDWMIAKSKPRAPELRELELTVFESVFETILDKVAEGMNLKTILDLDRRGISKGKLIRWIMKDDERRTRYYAAQQTGAEIIFEECIDIADGAETFEDVQRSKLRIDTRKWVLGIHDKKRFGEKQPEMNVNINLGEAMAAAAQRVEQMRNLRVVTQDGEVVSE